MKKIGLLSDTHSFLDPKVFELFAQCDEVWHAGDFGDVKVSDQLSSFKLLRGVFGNIDGTEIRNIHPEEQIFLCEDVKVYMKHIGGYPENYAPGIRDELYNHTPDLFISGHSHILKVMRDDKLKLLHINPGAAGKHGLHKVRTMVRFHLNENKIENLEVIELGMRGSLA